MPDKKAFLSSTGRDLAEYREAAHKAIRGLDGWRCVRMEDFGARDWDADEFCRANVAECDLLVGVVGHLYGGIPKGKKRSYTEREYEAAVLANVPGLMFLAPEDFPMSAKLREPTTKWRQQQAFRQRVNSERIRDTFRSPEDLAWRVVKAIRNWEMQLAKEETATLIPALDRLLWPHASGDDETAGFQASSHDDLLRALRIAVERNLGEHVRVTTLQSLADAGCDIEVTFAAQGLKYGIQVKSHGDIAQADFASKTLAQIQDSHRHGLKRLYVVLAGDLTNRSQREKVRGLQSRISQMKDDYVMVVPPEQAWTLACEATPSAKVAPKTAPLSLPPQPYFAHPYPLDEKFVGRVGERQMLSDWLTGDQRPVMAVIGVGGMGKSALAWAWLQRDVLGLPLPGRSGDAPEIAGACRVPRGATPEGIVTWSFYRQASLNEFLSRALSYASDGGVDPNAIPSDYDKIEALISLLRERRLLLMLDGAERLLRAYAGVAASYRGDSLGDEGPANGRSCADPNASILLSRLAAGPLPSRVLVTSRLFPGELEGLPGARRHDLEHLDPDSAVTLLRAAGIRGTRGEMVAACEVYEYHPLSLRLLSGIVRHDKQRPGDIRVARRYRVLPELRGEERRPILEPAFERLKPRERVLLSRISAFRGPVRHDALLAVSNYADADRLDAALEELTGAGLLFFDRERGRYDLHPIVRRYAYDRLRDRESVHARLRDYFAAVPAPGADEVRTLADLAPAIELYYHTVGAGLYDEARELLEERLDRPLYYRFGAYQTFIELLRALFPDGEECPPRLKKEPGQAWTLGWLGGCYVISGQPRRGVDLIERDLAIVEKLGDQRNMSTVVGNLAIGQVILGELAAADDNFRRKIALCEEVGDQPDEGVGHLELGRLLAYEGAFQKCYEHLAAAQDVFDEVGASETNYVSVVRAYRALRALLMGDADDALSAAREARRLADEVATTRFAYERDFVLAEWLMGWALVALASEEKSKRSERLAEAEEHLTEALRRCRRINMVDHEPDILLAWARWHRVKRQPEDARKCAEEALAIADRCEYRLVQADAHNLLSRLALDEGERKTAHHHADIAKERAWCDGPPHCYKPALEEAERLLKEAGKGK